MKCKILNWIKTTPNSVIIMLFVVLLAIIVYIYNNLDGNRTRDIDRMIKSCQASNHLISENIEKIQTIRAKQYDEIRDTLDKIDGELDKLHDMVKTDEEKH